MKKLTSITTIVSIALLFTTCEVGYDLFESLLGEETLTMASPDEVSGLALWLKADAITGLSDDDEVPSWPDSSGNGYDSTQTVNTFRPLWKESMANGKPAILFDGVNDYMIMPEFMNFSDATIIVVATAADITSDVIFGDSDGTNTIMIGSANSGKIFGAAANSALIRVDPASSAGISTNNNITVFRLKDTTGELYINGTQVDTKTNALYTPGDCYGVSVPTIGRSPVNDGSWHYQHGYIAELIIYDHALTKKEIARLELYLSKKYKITVTIDTLSLNS